MPLKERFFIQPLSPAQAAQRAKSAAQDIKDTKSLIAKKAWPYVQNSLRNSAGYLRYDLNTVISSKSKEEKKALKALAAKLYDSLDAVRSHSSSKSYDMLNGIELAFFLLLRISFPGLTSCS